MEDPSFILPSTVNGDNKSSTGLDEPLDIEESLSSKKEPHTSSVSFAVPPTSDDIVPPTDDYNSHNIKNPTTNAGNRQSIGAFSYGVIDETHSALRGFEPDIRSMVVKRIKLTDTDGDGRISRDEYVFSSAMLAKDAVEGAHKEKNLKRTVGGLSFLFAIGMAANFGLIYAVLILTRQLDTQNGNLVDYKTLEPVNTRAMGNRVFVEVSPEYQQRHLALQIEHKGDNGNFVDSIRKLNEDEPIATLEGMDAVAACKYFRGYELGSVSMYCLTCGGSLGSDYMTGSLIPGQEAVYHHVLTDGEQCNRISSDENLCDTYSNLVASDNDKRFEVKCCGSSGCTLHASTVDGEHEQFERFLKNGEFC